MNDFVLRVLGFDMTRIPEDVEPTFTLTNPLQSWWVVVMVAVIAAAAYGVFYLYRRELDSCPKPARIFLAVVRTLVLLVLAVVFLGPAVSYMVKRTVQPDVVVLVDTSQSMSVADRYLDEASIAPVVAATGRSADDIRSQQPTRIALVSELMGRDGGKFITDLSANGKKVQLKTFSSSVVNQQVTRSGDEESEKPERKRAQSHLAFEPRLPPPALIGLGILGLAAIGFLGVKYRQLDSWSYLGLLGGTTVALAIPLVLLVNPYWEEPPADESTAADTAKAAGPLVATLPDFAATGQGSLYGKAIGSALETRSGNPVAAMILWGDGQHTSKEDDPRAQADKAGERKIPIFTIGMGDPSKPRNIRIVDVAAEEQVWRTDPFEIRTTIEATAADAMTVQVNVVEHELNSEGNVIGNGQVIDNRVINFPAGGGKENIVLKRQPRKEGSFRYTVDVPVEAGEQFDKDNSKFVNVKVLKEQAKVLLIAGGPTWEFRLVQGLYTRDPTIDVSCWLQSMDVDMAQEGDTKIEKLPFKLEELSKYDLIMMFDPDPAEFNEAWFDTLKKYLDDNAGGFLYMAGPKYSTRFLVDPKTRGLRDVLPIRLADATQIEQSEQLRHSKEFALGVIKSETDHPIMRFDVDKAVNADRWERMPGIFWSFPALEAKPATRTLIQHTNPEFKRTHGPRPLLVTGQYGPGRTAYMGFNGTWRWRRIGKDAEYFNKYWVQMSRYLVEGKLLLSKRRGTLETAGERFNIGDNVPITARLFDSSFQPLEAKSVKAVVRSERAGETTVELQAVRGQKGQFDGSVTAANLGMNELAITLPGDKDGEEIRIVKQFEVERSRIEYEDTRLNKSLLQDIAQRSGGQYFELDQIDKIAAAIPDRTETITVAGKPAQLWDTDRLIYLLVGLLTIEWAVRKRFKLM